MMQATMSRAELADAAKWVGAVVGSDPRIPILNGMRLAFRESALELSAMDYESILRATVGLSSFPDGEGEWLISGRALAATLSAFRGDQVTLDADDEGVTATAGRSSAHFRPLSAIDYPSTAVGDGALIGAFDAGRLLEAVLRVAGMAARPDPSTEIIPWSLGVQLAHGGGRTSVVCATRYAIGRTYVDAEIGGVMIMPRVVDMLEPLRGMSGGLDLRATDGRLTMITASRSAAVRLLDPTVPDLGRILDAPTDANVTVDADMMRAALKLAETASNRVLLGMTRDSVTVEAIAPENGELINTASTTIDATPSDEASYRLDPKYLKPILAGLSGDVEIGYTPSKNKPVVFDDGTSKFCAMPMRG